MRIYKMLSARHRKCRVRVNVLLGNGNTKQITLLEVPLTETVANLKRTLQTILDITASRMFLCDHNGELQDSTQIRDIDEVKSATALYCFARARTDGHIQNLAFRPASPYARNRTTYVTEFFVNDQH